MRSLVIAAVALAFASTAQAQAKIGAQLSWGDDYDLGIGPRVEVSLPSQSVNLRFVGSFDYFFPDNSQVDYSYWELNGNLAYSFVAQGANSIMPYVGGGLNIATGSVTVLGVSDSNTEMGLNLLLGTQFESKNITPYVELRAELSGGEQFVIAGGFLF